MCTVTYLPKSNNTYILTSSRDELIHRKSENPATYTLAGRTIFFPKDPKTGGTWIAYSHNRTVCLLNGAFEKHVSTPPYRKSRGQVVIDYFLYDNLNEFVCAYSFEHIEPFTLVVIEDVELMEFRWDGKKGSLTPLDRDKPYIWSSCTLYQPPVIKKREQWFAEWLKIQSTYSVDSIREFHKTGGDGDMENGFRMQRENGLQTISITSIEKNDNKYFFIHENLIPSVCDELLCATFQV